MASKNPYLKTANQEQEYTYDQIQELKRCAHDPVYFIKTYVRIQHPKHGTIPFSLYDYQEEIIQAFYEERYTIVLSARQTGKCVAGNTKITTGIAPTGIRKAILWLVDRNSYNQIFHKIIDHT